MGISDGDKQCWIESLHDKLVDHKTQIQIDKPWHPKKRRENDQIIMDNVRQHLPVQYWGPVNQCRLYLKALTFADLITFDGTQIPDSVCTVQQAYRKI